MWNSVAEIQRTRELGLKQDLRSVRRTRNCYSERIGCELVWRHWERNRDRILDLDFPN